MSMNGCGVDEIPAPITKSLSEHFERVIAAARDKAEAAKKAQTPAPTPTPIAFLRDKPAQVFDRVIIGGETVVFEYCRSEWMERQRDDDVKRVAVLMPYAEYQELVSLRNNVDALAARNAAKAK